MGVRVIRVKGCEEVRTVMATATVTVTGDGDGNGNEDENTLSHVSVSDY